MLRSVLMLAALSAFLLLTACAGSLGISQEEAGSTPTTYATVVNPPDPALMGHWRRPNPSGLSKPWLFHYWLVKHGDKYAVYYHYDSRKKNSFRGWASFTIDGKTMTSGVDAVTFTAESGGVIMRYPGRGESYRMEKVED